MDRVVWKIKNVVENAKKIQEMCISNGISLVLVTKFAKSMPELVLPVMKEAGIKAICDSNCQNFKDIPSCYGRYLIKTTLSSIKYIKYKYFKDEEFRKSDFHGGFPQVSEKTSDTNSIPSRVYLSDKILLDEIAGLPVEIRPEIVLVLEAGDLREGLSDAEVLELAEQYRDLNIVGVSANFACLSGGLPTIEDIKKLADFTREFARKRNIPPFLSVGGTVMIDLLKSGGLKGLVQEIRMGEGVFFAYNTSNGSAIPGLSDDLVYLEAEIIEVKEKCVPEKNPAGDSAESKSAFATRNALEEAIETGVFGIRKRAVLDSGVLFAPHRFLEPVDKEIFCVGQTYDFTVMDITDSKNEYKTGDFIIFKGNYGSLASAMINPFVSVEICNG